jgi:hypothetical protein
LSNHAFTREDMMEEGTLASDMSERGRTYATERHQTVLPDTLSLKIRLKSHSAAVCDPTRTYLRYEDTFLLD